MLKEKINEDFKKAFKEKQDDKVSILKMLKAAILNKEKDKQYQLAKQGKQESAALTDEEIIDVVSSEIKKLRDSVVLFDQGNRADLVQKTKNEIDILMAYLPQQISEDEIKKLVAQAVSQTGATNVKDMGKVMGVLMPQTKGKADSATVSRLVKEALQA